MGFAVYLDMLDYGERQEYDVDVLLLYDESVKPAVVLEAMEKLSKEGRTVRASKRDDEKLSYRTLLRLSPSGEIR